MTRVKSVSDNGREAEARRRTELAIRVASAVVLAALAIGAIIYQPWTFLILVIVGSLLVAWEWGQLTRGNGFDGTALISGVSVATVAILVFLGRPDLALFVLAAAAVAIGLRSVSTGRSVCPLAGLAYAALPAVALLFLRGDAVWGATAALYLFVVAWATDTASYAAGSLLGGPKLGRKSRRRRPGAGLSSAPSFPLSSVMLSPRRSRRLRR